MLSIQHIFESYKDHEVYCHIQPGPGDAKIRYTPMIRKFGHDNKMKILSSRDTIEEAEKLAHEIIDWNIIYDARKQELGRELTFEEMREIKVSA